MSSTLKGWNRSTMMSLFKKEATYDAGVVMNNSPQYACSMNGYELDVTWPDKLLTDKDEITGKEHGYSQDFLTKGVKMVYKEDKVKPNTLAGLLALALGSVTTSSVFSPTTGYDHYIKPVAVGTGLPSIEVTDLFGGLQYTYKGVKCDKLKLSGKQAGPLALSADLIGSGTRDVSALAFAAAISESWLLMGNCKVWMETGADISIAASPAPGQGSEDISSATPDILGPRMESFDLDYDNKLKGQYGFGGGYVLVDQDFERREIGLKLGMRFVDATELALFLALSPCAIEFDLSGSIIYTTSPAGTLKYGCSIIIPRMMLKQAPLPKGGPNNTLTCDLDFEVFEDGTNPAIMFHVYNAQAAYLA
jgi:hypothetical protein